MTFDPSRISQLYGLSRAEARVAALLASGYRLEQAAEILGIAYETVRKHLKRDLRQNRHLPPSRTGAYLSHRPGRPVVVAMAIRPRLVQVASLGGCRDRMLTQDMRIREIQIGQPARYVLNGRVGSAILIEELVALNFKADVINTVSDCIDEVLAMVFNRGAVTLDLVKSGFAIPVIVAVQDRPFIDEAIIGADPFIDTTHFVGRNRHFIRRPCRADRSENNPVHGSSGLGAVTDVVGRRLLR